jgi:putative SOS response-associated peptidase YedK
MCGRYKGPDTWAELHEVLSGFAPPAEARAVPAEFRPTNKVPIVLPSAAGFEVSYARWGIVPSFWTKPLKEWKAATFNARLEDVATKSSFRTAWKLKQFCLMPASYFWEWSGEHPTKKGKLQRWRIGRADNHQLVFAGLYDNATTADGLVTSCTMLMHDPGKDMEPFHDREPAILHPDEWEPFLAGRLDRDLKDAVAPGTLRGAIEVEID